MQAPALIVVDMLNDLLETWPPASKQRLIRSINSLVGMMHFKTCIAQVWLKLGKFVFLGPPK